ncbi:MAG: sugar ABC transporter ATP-binding protein [Rhodospirillales bacterium]|nr:D-xylose ABC transporter ATP-binding protein [Rhodospirillaceae bacterium]MDP6427774.1 sugar ABC transporter ATP-binding protein [Rhodospirillales bacterium]MDP6644592.1 sugar ABC transporter ATP-binding protein [Rhodospirillales bacterium]MDP6840274.1 sugar ABC transporter ATP-binding protein [Rhodospirillales bacterium]
MADNTDLLAVREISKQFYGTQALNKVSFDLAAGEVHTLVGENGAGKSTLIRILGGIYKKDSGEIIIDGAPSEITDPREALNAGIVIIPQEMQLVPDATVAENVTLGEIPSTRWLGFIPALDRRRMRERAGEALKRLNYHGPLDISVNRLPFAERQLVVIAKALLYQARILILDEPTASLEHREAERLFEIIHSLKEQKVGIIYVSHRLEEVVELSDRCTTLRDGKVVDVSIRGEIEKENIIRLMTGRDLQELHHPHKLEFGDPLIEYDGELNLRRGEVLGLAGLLGSGTPEYLQKLFGAGDSATSLTIAGNNLNLRKPKDAINNGIGMVPGERRKALMYDLSVRDNIVLPHLSEVSNGWRLDMKRINNVVDDLMETLDIRPRDPKKLVRFLSGGNQQKVIFARWLMGNPKVLLLDKPTDGIDVGAKARIHRLMRDFTEQGGGVLFASSEMVEVINMSDNILAMRQGDIVARMSRESGEYSEGYLREALGG